jgi:Tol biopolymer transport system component
VTRRPRPVALLLMTMLALTACTQNATPPRDPGKVVLPAKQVSVPGRLYATKGRSLYVFSGTHLTKLLAGVRVKDPAVDPDGSQLAFARLQDQSSTIAVSDARGRNLQTITPATAPEGALWALAPRYSDDGQRIVYLTDRGKLRSDPQNLQPNDLGVWRHDLASGQSHPLVAPVPYTGGDSDPAFRPGANEQLLYTTYLYGGVPLESIARLTWMSLRTGARVYLSPDGARNFEPAFSPDGRFVAFVHAGSGSDDLSVMPLAASFNREPRPEPTQAAVLLQAGIVSQPVWAPDGSSIAFLMLVNGSFDLFIVSVTIAPDGSVHATGPSQAVTHGSFLDADSRLAWSP